MSLSSPYSCRLTPNKLRVGTAQSQVFERVGQLPKVTPGVPVLQPYARWRAGFDGNTAALQRERSQPADVARLFGFLLTGTVQTLRRSTQAANNWRCLPCAGGRTPPGRLWWDGQGQAHRGLVAKDYHVERPPQLLNGERWPGIVYRLTMHGTPASRQAATYSPKPV